MTAANFDADTAASPVALAMDWGGTWARAAVIDRQGRLMWQDRVANAAGATQDELVDAGGGLLRRAQAAAGLRAIAGLGVALAGSIDAGTDMLLSSPNLPALNGVVLPTAWAPMLGAPVWVGNDANLAALGEYHFGAGRPTLPENRAARTLVYVTFSTGVGAGIVNDGDGQRAARFLHCLIQHRIHCPARLRQAEGRFLVHNYPPSDMGRYGRRRLRRRLRPHSTQRRRQRQRRWPRVEAASQSSFRRKPESGIVCAAPAGYNMPRRKFRLG